MFGIFLEHLSEHKIKQVNIKATEYTKVNVSSVKGVVHQCYETILSKWKFIRKQNEFKTTTNDIL